MKFKKRKIVVGALTCFGLLLDLFSEAFQISFADAIKQFSQAIKTGQWPYAAKQS